MADTIYKILPERSWLEAVTRGSFGGSPVDVADGFIHFSTASQVRDTAAKHFAGVSNLLIVAVSTADLGAQLRWEPSRGGDLFPHFYAALPMAAVRWVTAAARCGGAACVSKVGGRVLTPAGDLPRLRTRRIRHQPNHDNGCSGSPPRSKTGEMLRVSATIVNLIETGVY